MNILSHLTAPTKGLQGIFEMLDNRTRNTNKYTASMDMGPLGIPGMYDPKVWSSVGYGKKLQQSLPNKNGYYNEVTDFGAIVAVRAGHHESATGKGKEKTFVIVFDSLTSGNGRIFTSSTRWRTISSVDQAASYIKSVIDAI